MLLNEVSLERCRDFVRRLECVVDCPVPCSVVNHTASIAQWVLRPLDRVHLRHEAATPIAGRILEVEPEDRWLLNGRAADVHPRVEQERGGSLDPGYIAVAAAELALVGELTHRPSTP